MPIKNKPPNCANRKVSPQWWSKHNVKLLANTKRHNRYYNKNNSYRRENNLPILNRTNDYATPEVSNLVSQDHNLVLKDNLKIQLQGTMDFKDEFAYDFILTDYLNSQSAWNEVASTNILLKQIIDNHSLISLHILTLTLNHILNQNLILIISLQIWT